MDNARIVVTRSGGPEVLSFAPAPMPEPGPGEVRVRVLRAGAAFADVLLQRGVRSTGAGPRVPGFEFVGEIDALGPGATRAIGERVAALTIFGSYARYVVVPEERLLDVPRELPLTTAACLPLNYLTAYQMLHRVARARAGDTVLVWGAAGGVGLAALELARAADIRVIGASSPSKREEITRRGGVPIDSSPDGFVKRLRALAPNGVDAALDAIAGRNFLRSACALRRGGTLVAFGLASVAMGQSRVLGMASSVFSLACAHAMRRRVSIYGIDRVIPRDMPSLKEDFSHIAALAVEGTLEPKVWMQLPLHDAARAHTELEARAVVGKIILDCEDPPVSARPTSRPPRNSAASQGGLHS